MRNYIARYSIATVALACAFAAIPFTQVLAHGADARMQTSADNQTVPDKAADAWITTKVKAELAADEHVKASDIKVETNDSTVMLSGMVASNDEKMLAVRKAESVKGVKSVDASRLEVKDMHRMNGHGTDAGKHSTPDLPAYGASVGH